MLEAECQQNATVQVPYAQGLGPQIAGTEAARRAFGHGRRRRGRLVLRWPRWSTGSTRGASPTAIAAEGRDYRVTPVTHLGGDVFGVLCPLASLCVAGSVWPSVSFCVALDGYGDARIGRATPTVATVKSLLAPSGGAARIAALLWHHGYVRTFRAPNPGRFTISWYLVPRGAHLARTTPKAVLIASGSSRAASAGTLRIAINLTSYGKRLLAHATRVTLTAEGSFTPTGIDTVTAFSTFTVRR
jgi:hypothetical protein